jgi:hypothetical protein
MSYPGSSAFVGSGSYGIQLTTEQSQGGGAAHNYPISTDGAHAHNVTVTPNDAHSHGVNFDGAHTHELTVETLPRSTRCALIVLSQESRPWLAVGRLQVLDLGNNPARQRVLGKLATDCDPCPSLGQLTHARALMLGG